MKKKLFFAGAVLAAFALMLTACGKGDSGKIEDAEWPDFSNAQKLEVEHFPSNDNPGMTATEWKFSHPGGAEDEDYGAPANTKTFKNSTYLLIATMGGGKVGGTGNSAKTEFHQPGFHAVKFKVDGGNTSAWLDYVENTIRPQKNTAEIIPFPHEEDEIIYFVYDLSIYQPSLSVINNTDSAIVFKIAWEEEEKSLGQYQAYITSASLTRGTGYELKNDSTDTLLPHDTVLGWVTRDPGLTLAP